MTMRAKEKTALLRCYHSELLVTSSGNNSSLSPKESVLEKHLNCTRDTHKRGTSTRRLTLTQSGRVGYTPRARDDDVRHFSRDARPDCTHRVPMR